jgi:hypothetical protein
MATEKTITKYQCPYCDEEYLTEHEAESCLERCAEPDQCVQEIEGSVFLCDMCGKEWDDQEEAEECEQNHREREDLYYGNYLSKKDKEYLDIAASHPSQTRIARW